MRRADRLFRIVQMLRAGRLRTARTLAERLQVSERTIYRDIRDLQLNGQPIEGTAGLRYTLRRDFDLPPLTFCPEELTSPVLGARLVQAWGGETLVAAAGSALARIEAVLPPQLAERIGHVALYAPAFVMTRAHRRLLDVLHTACQQRQVLCFVYTRLASKTSEAERRTVRPLGLAFWSGVWTLTGWDEIRKDFRSFRLDRIARLEQTGRTFQDERGKRLGDFMQRVKAEARSRPRV